MKTSNDRYDAVRTLGPGFAGMALVGASVTVSRALVGAPLLTAQAIRYAAAALVLFALAKALRIPVHRPRGRAWLWLGGIAASGLALFNVAVVRGVAHAEPAVIAVAVACVPLVLGVVGPLWERQRPGGRVLLAAPVVVAGAVMVQGTGRADAEGVVWAAVALACEAAFTLLAVPVLREHGPWGVSLHSVWMGAVLLAVLGVVVEGPTAAARLDGPAWAAMAYLAVLVTAVAFVLWYFTVSRVGSARAGLLSGVAPVAAVLAGTAADGSVPRLPVWLGMGLVLAGLAVGLRPGRTAAAPVRAASGRRVAPRV
ncbi:DMT family transporter [Streptomyces bambusae]|uniref:DMT family transporter n=1 Tax=Streptomyces bambusae TaxID=1550616 RepID=UPI001CFF7630|nr:DMT family transporter [Streptomyces bambusae]MCB5169087.1 DMT family transporter [Streptomyces bambusae]